MGKGYHLLRFIGVVYKLLGVIFLLVAGSVACVSMWASTEALTLMSRYGLSGVPTLICINIGVFLFAGGIPAIFFWVLASLIELLVNINHKVDLLTAYLTVRKNATPPPTQPTKLSEAEAFLQRAKDRTK